MICDLTHITPIARMEAIRMFLANATHKGFTGYQMDVKTAFLHGSLKEDMLKQVLRAWYDELSTFLLQNKFSKGIIDLTLFTRRFDYDILVVQVYVDDIIFGSTNARYATLFSDQMKSRFEMSMIGEMTFFLGLQDNQSPSGIFINQSNYVNEILKKYGLNTCDTIDRTFYMLLVYVLDTKPSPLESTSKSQNQKDLPKDTSIDRLEVLSDNGNPFRANIKEALGRSAMIHQALDRLCLNVEVDEHSLGDLNEPNNYKAAILDLESDKWVDAMNAKIQTMKDNQVWCLVDLPPNCKTNVRKWIFKKKTNMDGLVHTYKAHLVAKGYTQTNRFDYKETLSPVADIRDIRILIAIEAFYNYEIWMDTSKRGYIPMQERNDLNKTHSASTPKEVKRMKNVPYASAVGSIMYATAHALVKKKGKAKDEYYGKLILDLDEKSPSFEPRGSPYDS
nr:copia protein [Tanacetum cinerariifolium]